MPANSAMSRRRWRHASTKSKRFWASALPIWTKEFGDVEANVAARLDGIETLLGERFAHLDEKSAMSRRTWRHASTKSKRFWASALSIWTKEFGRLEDRMEHLIALAQQLLKK